MNRNQLKVKERHEINSQLNEMETRDHSKNGANLKSQMSRRNIWKNILLGLSLLCFCSCSNDGRLVKKFIKRMNAKEINAASKYIYPADHANLYFFNEEVFKRTPNLLLKLIDKQNIDIEGEKAIVVKIECKNISPFFVNYMKNLKMINNNNIIIDTIYIKKTRDGDKITFDWAKIKGENLYLACIDNQQKSVQNKVSSLNIRSDENENSNIIGELTKDKKIVINEYRENPEWYQCFTIDHKCNIVQGYINESSALKKESLFFTLGIFDGLSLLVAVIILVVIAFPICMISIIAPFLRSIEPTGIIAPVALVLGLLYVAYQLLENILFELFLINLPY
jgi:hypothetical protein